MAEVMSDVAEVNDDVEEVKDDVDFLEDATILQDMRIFAVEQDTDDLLEDVLELDDVIEGDCLCFLLSHCE